MVHICCRSRPEGSSYQSRREPGGHKLEVCYCLEELNRVGVTLSKFLGPVAGAQSRNKTISNENNESERYYEKTPRIRGNAGVGRHNVRW